MDTEMTTLQTKAYETKSGMPLDAVVTHAEMMRAFDAFKETNDQRLALERKNASDALVEEKLARINAALDARARAQTGFRRLRARRRCRGLAALNMKALSVGSNADCGYTVPDEIETEIGWQLSAISPIRSIAGVRTISGSVYKKPFMTAGPAVGWVGETDPRTQTASTTLDQLSLLAMELFAMPAATATLLEDSAVNIDQWL